MFFSFYSYCTVAHLYVTFSLQKIVQWLLSPSYHNGFRDGQLQVFYLLVRGIPVMLPCQRLHGAPFNFNPHPFTQHTATNTPNNQARETYIILTSLLSHPRRCLVCLTRGSSIRS